MRETIRGLARVLEVDADLLEAFLRYERALASDDVEVLDALFAPGEATIRSYGGDALVGHERISAFRAARGAPPERTLRRVHVRALNDDAAVIVAESVHADGRAGVQTQVWGRGGHGRGGGRDWAVEAAHVSAGLAPTSEQPPMDPRDAASVWRVPPGPAPLARGASGGSLDGIRVAVKDLFAIAGQRVGAGNPAWLAAADEEPTNAAAVQRLIDVGGDIVGITHTDELAFSLAGENPHHGTPPNPAAPGRIPGGSTSGSASAVAHGSADLGLGTDTAGSIRVPASYCGLHGLRTSHGAVDRTGLVGLAPSFDTVGLLARDLATLSRAARSLLPPAPPGAAVTRLVVVPQLRGLADPAVQVTVEAATTALALRSGVEVGAEELDPDALERWFTAFRTVQQAEAWRGLGHFVEHHAGALDPAVEGRFRQGAEVSDDELVASREVLAGARTTLELLLPPGTALALPTTSGPAPRRDLSASAMTDVRAATLRLTFLASSAGLPALSLPSGRVGALPVGLCLLASHGHDVALLDLADKDAKG